MKTRTPRKDYAGRLYYFASAILEPGTAVRLADGVKGPPCRTGVVIEHRPQNGGYLVKHDEPDELLQNSVLANLTDGRTFGWCYHEVVPIQ